MANSSKEITNSTLVVPFRAASCFTKPDYGLIFCYFVMSLCALVGIPAHLWCLCLYLSFCGKFKQNHFFLLNQTIMELLCCIESAIETLNELIFMNNNLFLVTCCIFGLSWTGRALIQTCICIEQYFAVLHPITFLKYKSIKYRISAVAAAWLMAFGYGLYESYFQTFTNPIFNSAFIVAVAVITFCCVSVLRALKHPGPGDRGKDVRNQQKENAFNMIFSILLIIVFTYVPLAALSIFTVVQIQWVLFYCNVAPLFFSLSFLSLIITPLLKMYKEGYLIKYQNQRNL